MDELCDVLESIDDFGVENSEKTVMEWIEQKGYNRGDVMNAMRLCVVGEGKGPHMFDITSVIGKEETLRRIRKAINILK